MSQSSAPRREPRTLDELLATYERVVIIRALQLNDGCRSRTATSLGVPRKRLYRRIATLGIDLDAVLVALGRPRRRRAS